MINQIKKAIKLSNQVMVKLINYNYNSKVSPSISQETLINYNINRKFGAKKELCFAPKTNLHFRFNGDVNACCFNKNMPFGNISKNKLIDIWNSEHAMKLRNNIENYNLKSGCNFCQKQLEANNFDGLYAQIFDPLPLHASHQKFPTSMTFELNNTCNLECIMCTGDYSNLIRKNREHKAPQPMLYNDSFVEELKYFIPNLKSTNFVGGEPLLIKIYYKIWNEILKSNKKCVINIQSNGTIINEDFLNLLESKQFNMGISIDAIHKETYEEIRKNANFESVMANIDTLSDLHKKGIIGLWFNFCPMVVNWKEIIPFMQFATSKGIKVNLLTVIIPRHLSLRSLKSDELLAIKNSLMKEMEVLSNDYFQTLSAYLNQIQNWLNQALSKEMNPILPSINSKENFEYKIQNAKELQGFGTEQISDFLNHIDFKTKPLEPNLQFKVYHNLIDEIDYFFDDSIEYLDLQELKDGFDKLIRWEIENYNFSQ